MMWCHHRISRFLVLVLILFVQNVHGQCPTDFEDISTDPLQERCVYVSDSADTTLNFAQARHACQKKDPSADLINFLTNEISDLMSLANYDSTETYFVGLTNAAISSNIENVLDCSAYDPLLQPLESTVACSGADCNCFAYNSQSTDFDLKSCLTVTHRYICGLSNSADYVDVICPTGWVKVKDRCYRYYTGETAVTTFQEAQDVCYAECGNLARVNFYDCNYAGILGGRPNTGISYLVGLMGTAGNEEWRDNSMPDSDLIYTTGSGSTSNECFVLKDDGDDGDGALERVSCNDGSATQNFICERESLIPTTPGMETTQEDATTEEILTTERSATTQIVQTTDGGEPTTVAVDVETTAGPEETTQIGGESTTSREITTDPSDFNGFILDDPCNPNPCDQTGPGAITCTESSDSSPECVCSTGFELDSSLGPCVDINECERNQHTCDVSTEICVNNDGGFTCNEINTGNEDGVNECANSDLNTCDLSTTFCQDTSDGFTCECSGSRVRISESSCTDQCTAGVDGCDTLSTSCVADADGSALCQCNTGYQPIAGNSNACQLFSGISARMVVPVTSIDGEEAVYGNSLEDSSSSESHETGEQLCDAIENQLGEEIECRAAGFSSGSIIAYLQVTIPRPNKIRDYEQMKNALVDGPLDEKGYVTLYTSDGTEITIDPNRLDVDDVDNYVCRQSTCQNGGTCFFEERFIQPGCRCPEGFQGTRCETNMTTVEEDNSTELIVDNSTGLIVGLTLIAVFLLIVVTGCFCCFCVLSRRKLQTHNKRIFRYQPPVAVPPSDSSRHYGIQRVFSEASANADRPSDRPTNFPHIVRNRAVDRGMEMHRIENENYGYEPDDYDQESFLDDHRMKQYKKFFSNSGQLNSRMSSRGDGASTTSSATSPHSSSHLDDEEGRSHDFYRPYTVDGTTNI